jgi:hypothetical protein
MRAHHKARQVRKKCELVNVLRGSKCKKQNVTYRSAENQTGRRGFQIVGISTCRGIDEEGTGGFE